MDKEQNRLRVNELARYRYFKNQNKYLAKNKKYRELFGYKERIREQTLERKRVVLTYYGNTICACVKCGFSNIKALSIDHINGREVGELKDKATGDSFYRKIIKNNFPLGYQTLCMNCQFIKREEEHEFRNQYTGRK